MDKSNLGRKELVSVSVFKFITQGVREELKLENWSWEAGAEAVEGAAYWLALHGLVSLPAARIQVALTCRTGPPIATINQENVLMTGLATG